MNWDEVFLIVKNSEGRYLDNADEWILIQELAWPYTSAAAFVDAENYNGKVYLHLPSGREIEVTRKDFEL